MKVLTLISLLDNFIWTLKKVFINILITLAFIGIASFSFASVPYCENFFENGIQAYGDDSFVRFNYNAQLLNGYSSVSAKKVFNNNWSIKKSCAYEPCSATGWVTYDMTPPALLETNATNEVIIPADKKVTVGSNNILQYGKIVVSERSVATFKPQTTPYIISQLEVGYKSKLRLPAGEYWVSRLRLEVEGRIDVIGEGQVTLYVIDSLWVPFNFRINDNTKNPAKIAIYTFSDSNYYTGSKTYAFIRSEGEVILNYRATVVGSVLGKFVNLEAESQVVYDPAAVRTLQIKDYCRAFPFPLDIDPPMVVINQFDDYTEANHTLVTGTIIDSGEHASGVGEVSININGGWVPLPLTGNSFSIDLPLDAPDNWFTILAYDLAGNEAFIPFYAGRIFPE